MREKFPRKCDATGVGMHEGFVAVDGMYHFSEEKYLIEFLRANGYDDHHVSDNMLLEEAYANDDYYHTEWDVDDEEYWYEVGDYGHLVLVSLEESVLRDKYILYDEDKDRLYQREDGLIITYFDYEMAYYWEHELNKSDDDDYKYEAMEATFLPDHQIKRLYNQIKKKS